ncbi:hypothetical protein [Bacteriovorax sp. DB6_IX]|uniref:hypothetical protein n=1 Tax=Bacteriovorax sp. DB6_IX TaxID=1353530 RepID=UPI00038A500A|nr:hypothetical protein [Bacteriovorax sp. DB6_IX]EQC51521.1 putative lipoprotein [Bacteriovorax sp. DB6_IX]
MNSKILFIFFSSLLLFSCGVKAPPSPSKDSFIPSSIDVYKKKMLDDASKDSKDSQKNKKKE